MRIQQPFLLPAERGQVEGERCGTETAAIILINSLQPF